MTRPDRPVTEDDLQAWVDDFLSPECRRKVDVWLESHPEARQRIMAWRQERDGLRTALDTELREAMPSRFDIGRLRARRFTRFSMPQMAASVVFALSLGLGGGWFLRDRQVPVGLASVEQEAAIVQGAGKGSTIARGSVAQLAAWGGSVLGRPVQPPDLSTAGYQPAGGQLVTTDHGPACLFFYTNDRGVRLSLFVRPMYRVDVTAPMRPMHHMPGYLWAQDGLGVSLVSDAPISGLHMLANHARDLMGEPS
nr:anti-sigma factor [uncultured Acetobacter sp.]